MLGMRRAATYASLSLVVVAGAVMVGAAGAPGKPRPRPRPPSASDSIVRYGRYLVISHACGGCHGGHDDPSAPGWLAGLAPPIPAFPVGPCAFDPAATPCYHTRPRNLTPDNETGLGRFTERQIFNALRYGLRPEDTPDVTITSMTPGQGNFPLHPHYLAPPMPWPAWRHMKDEDLQAIAAYLKRAVRPVHNKVPESEGPPDFWAKWYAEEPVDKIGPYPELPFPTANERLPEARTAGVSQP